MDGWTALMLGVQWSHIEIVTLLIKAGADVNVKDEEEGYTALMLAAKHGRIETVQ